MMSKRDTLPFTTSPIEVGIATRAMPSSDDAPCGDVGLETMHGERRLVGLIDGLGHGERASAIAEKARTAVLGQQENTPLDDVFADLDRTFRGDRGFVAALCRVDGQDGQLEFCGIGNITTRLFSDREHTLLSGNGIVGQYMTRPRARSMPFPAGSFLVMHSDGMSSHLHAKQLLDHRGQAAPDAALTLLDEHARPNDDCGVVVLRFRP